MKDDNLTWAFHLAKAVYLTEDLFARRRLSQELAAGFFTMKTPANLAADVCHKAGWALHPSVEQAHRDMVKWVAAHLQISIKAAREAMLENNAVDLEFDTLGVQGVHRVPR